jgi:hypothetical protein
VFDSSLLHLVQLTHSSVGKMRRGAGLMEPGQAGLQTRRVRLVLPRDAAGGSNIYGRCCLALPS